MKAALGLITLLATGASAQEAVPVWTLATPKAAPASLTYGLSPDISLECVRKSGQIAVQVRVDQRLAQRKIGTVWVNAVGVPAPWPVSVTFASGPATSSLRGQANADSDPTKTTVSTEISTLAPVLKAFGKTGEISLKSLSATLTPLAAKPGMVRKFLSTCKA